MASPKKKSSDSNDTRSTKKGQSEKDTSLQSKPKSLPDPECGEPGGGRGRVEKVGPTPKKGVRIDPDIMEGQPGYEESGTSEMHLE